MTTKDNIVSTERTDNQYLAGEAYKRYLKKCAQAKREYHDELRKLGYRFRESTQNKEKDA